MAVSGSPTSQKTIIDVLEEQLGGDLSEVSLHDLAPAAIESLATEVGRFYQAWGAPTGDADEMRIYSGGWIARNFLGDNRQYLLTSLLYAPSVVIHDPIAEWFDPHRQHLEGLPGIPSGTRNPNGQPTMTIASDELTLLKGSGFYVAGDRAAATREFLAQVLPALVELAPLIRSGVVLPVPELSIVRALRAQLAAAVRVDTRDNDLRALIKQLNEQGTPPARSNSIRGLEVVPGDGVAAGHEAQAIVQNPAFYFEKTLAIASHLAARYVPPSVADAALLEYRLRQLDKEIRSNSNWNVELRIIPALVHSELPFFENLDASLLLKIRNDEEAFAAWRMNLRNAVRKIETLPSEGSTFEQEAQDVLALAAELIA
jgi:hypothetical protein